MVGFHESKDPDFPEIKTSQLEEAVKEGLQCLILCKRGLWRSGTIAAELNKSGFKSIKLRGGVEGLENLTDEEIIQFGQQLQLVPLVFITLTSLEAENKELKKIINLLEQGYGKKLLIETDILRIKTYIRRTEGLKRYAN